MPYKNKEDRRKAYKRWYYNHYPKSKDHIVEYNKNWRKRNKDEHNKNERKRKRKRYNELKKDLRCPRCGAKLTEEEIQLYNHKMCSRCNTLNFYRKNHLDLNAVL